MPTLKSQLKAAGSPERAKTSAYLFKTGKGQYGYGDVFYGVSVPQQRKIAKQFRDLPLKEVERLLQSKVHEERLTASIILVDQYKKADEKIKTEIYNFYLANTKYINNWDIIDGSAEFIVGDYLQDKDKAVLVKLAKSKSLWERRIAILSTFAYIKQGESAETLKIAGILLHDPEDLIQKAVGWMLREAGKRCSREEEESFLQAHYKTMPRTMLRYAIEHFDEPRRQAYLKGTV